MKHVAHDGLTPPKRFSEGEELVMNICIPVNEDKGLQSPVCAHFGSAPAFMIVDTESR